MRRDWTQEDTECVRTICLVLAVAAGIALISYVAGHVVGGWYG